MDWYKILKECVNDVDIIQFETVQAKTNLPTKELDRILRKLADQNVIYTKNSKKTPESLAQEMNCVPLL